MLAISSTWSSTIETPRWYVLSPLVGGRWLESSPGTKPLRQRMISVLNFNFLNKINNSFDRYFIGTAEGKPAQRQLYKVSTGSVGAVSCVSCGTVNTDGLECTSNSASFSTGSTYYVHACNGPNIPRSVIKRTSVMNKISQILQMCYLNLAIFFITGQCRSVCGDG